jgi:hypothetical protein
MAFLSPSRFAHLFSAQVWWPAFCLTFDLGAAGCLTVSN